MTSSGITAARPMNPIAWLGLPMLLCVVGTVLLSLPIRIFGFALPQPVLPMVAAFAWPLIKPSWLTPFALLALGLFLDLFWWGPLGLWPLSLLGAYAGVLAVRRLILGNDYIFVWAWYAAATAAAFAVAWVLAAITAGSAPNLLALGWQYLWTAALFPFAHRLMGRYEDADVRFR